MGIAVAVAARSTCPRAAVGAVIVLGGKYIAATGYNGSAPGMDHCADAGCLIATDHEGVEHCMRVIHAEQNAINTAARLGVAIKGATIYTTHTPCSRCASSIAAAGMTIA